ncbi:unnamed protein product [Schistocephalus solidus]|uniref:Reverse transcriptase domain-containing protein n=1 Tax=Schistocephalus solidus TaxID=70667 RepID=A0A183SPG7_SCHSO|nr:unnamed protein product [Schistocephalus solidus]
MRNDDGFEISGIKNKAEHFLQFFPSFFSWEAVYFPSSYETMGAPIIQDMFFRGWAIFGELKILKAYKSLSPDEIPAKLLLELARKLAKPLSFLFQKSFDTGILPTDWNTAQFTPLHKSDSRALATNYRLISLTSICCKVMQKESDCDFAMFADDLKMWIVIHNAADEDNFQDNLRRLDEWSSRWLLSFNSNKYTLLRLGNRNQVTDMLPYDLNGPDEPGVGQVGAKSLYDLVFSDLFLFGFTNSPTSSTSNVGATSSSDVVLGCKARLLLKLRELSDDGGMQATVVFDERKQEDSRYGCGAQHRVEPRCCETGGW